jgi:shikimate kinase
MAAGALRCIAPEEMLQSRPSLPVDRTRWTGQPIVLVGLMGVGKSTVGRRLAARLSLPFVDADTEIEDAAGMTIAEIFDAYGEPYFRAGERRVIARLLDGSPKVIATGGGAFINEETRQTVLENGLAIWLDAPIEVLVDRVRRRDTRPLLRGRDPGEVLRDLAAARNPIYALAPIRVESNHTPHDVTVRAILEAIGR